MDFNNNNHSNAHAFSKFKKAAEDKHIFDSEGPNLDKPSLSTDHHTYVWSGGGNFQSTLRGYCIEAFVRRHADSRMECFVKGRTQFMNAAGRRIPVITEGLLVFTYRGNLCLLEVSEPFHGTIHTLRSGADTTPVVQAIESFIRDENPIRGRFLQITPTSDGITTDFRENPEIRREDVIADTVLIDDLYDNTLVTLRDLKESNGIIIHGRPGVGKSLCCNLAARWMLEAGYTVVYLDTRVPFGEFDAFIQQFCAPCMIILEDIDAFAEDRLRGRPQSSLSDFLQFMNGLAKREHPIIVLATTNHLDLLDEAIRNRPARFNRIYRMEDPDNGAIDRLLERYFGSQALSEEQRMLCHNRNLRGAHIQEIHRTARMIAHKLNGRPVDAFESAVRNVLGDPVSGTPPILGFNP